MESQPQIIVGLGNPGQKYNRTRHNIGRDFIDFILTQSKSSYEKSRQGEFFSLADFFGQSLQNPVHFLKLHSFMNVSGGPLRQFCHDKQLNSSDMLILVDDFMLPYGTARMRKKGSAGGHNGLQSIIDVFQSEAFGRLRIGIGPAPDGDDTKDFVLDKFSKEELKQRDPIFNAIKIGLQVLFKEGYEKAMSALNKNHLLHVDT